MVLSGYVAALAFPCLCLLEEWEPPKAKWQKVHKMSLKLRILQGHTDMWMISTDEWMRETVRDIASKESLI